MVGKNAIDHIIKNLKPSPKKVLEIYSTALPSNIIINENGTFNTPKIEFFIYKKDNSENDLIFVTGDAQPKSIIGTNNLSAIIADNLNILKVYFILSLAATPVISPKEHPKIYSTVTNPDDLKTFEKLGVKNFIRGAVTGMNGLVVAFSKMEHGVDGCILLSETYPNFIEDLRSSISIINFLCKYLNIIIPTDELEEKAIQAKSFYDSLVRKKQKKARVPKPEDLGYIR